MAKEYKSPMGVDVVQIDFILGMQDVFVVKNCGDEIVGAFSTIANADAYIKADVNSEEFEEDEKESYQYYYIVHCKLDAPYQS